MIWSRRVWMVGAAAISVLAGHPASSGRVVEGLSDRSARCAAVDRNPASDAGDVTSCRLERENSDRQLFERAIGADGDPVLEAKRSGDAGDFRFMGYSMLVPGIFPAAYGIACKPSIVSQGSRMVRALYLASDVPPMSEADAADRSRIEGRHRWFGERYNAALIADVRSPYRKICRLVSRDREAERGPVRKD